MSAVKTLISAVYKYKARLKALTTCHNSSAATIRMLLSRNKSAAKLLAQFNLVNIPTDQQKIPQVDMIVCIDDPKAVVSITMITDKGPIHISETPNNV